MKTKPGARLKTTADKKRSRNNLFFDGDLFLPRRNFQKSICGFFLLVSVLFGFGCQTQSLKANSTQQPQANGRAAEDDGASALEKDLQTMRNADFDFIYVFRRKDGNVLDGEDKKYLKANSPVSTNRFVLTEENKAVIAGSSYKFEKENLDNLQKRFVLENFSKPESQETTVNSNSGK